MSRRAEFEAQLRKPKVASWVVLSRAHKSIFSFLDSRLSKKNCSIPKYQILHQLYFDGPQAPVSLAKVLNVSRANIGSFIKRLLRDELIKPTTSYIEGGSARRPAYRLTYAGERYFEDIFEEYIQAIEAVMPQLPPEFTTLLQDISEKSDK